MRLPNRERLIENCIDFGLSVAIALIFTFLLALVLKRFFPWL